MNDFHENIKRWVLLDNDLTEIRNKSKEIRNEKQELTTNLYTHAENNNLDTAIIEISDGILKFQQMKQKLPLSFKFLEDCLNDCLDEEKVKHIIKYIKEKREEKISYIIKRIYKK
tara:strand:+ start:8 stop:352 length:345 start_codon:yes stop_codon:yes gene_type:complete